MQCPPIKTDRPTIQSTVEIIQETDEDKAFFGSPPSPTLPETSQGGRVGLLKELCGVVARERSELGALTIGRSSLRSKAKKALLKSLESVDQGTTNCPDPKQPRYMSGKKRPALPTPSLNMEQNQSEETPPWTGSPSGLPQSPEIWQPSPQMSEWSITGPYSQLEQIMTAPSLLYELVSCFGDLPRLVNLAGPGKKQRWVLILKIRERSSGVDIKVLIYLL